MKSRNRHLPALALLLVTMIWGSGFIATQYAIGSGLPTAWIMMIRFLVGSGVVALCFFRKIFPLSKRAVQHGGIAGFILFAAIMICYVQKSFSSIRTKPHGSRSRVMIAAGLSGIAGALTMGLTDYVWYNYRVFLIFWAVLALNAALIRINEKELAKEEASITMNMKSVDTDIYL